MTEPTQKTTKKKPRRTRRWAKIAALIIGALVLLAFLGCGLLMLWGSRRIHREIEAVKALHEPTNWDELLLTDRQGHVAPPSDAASDKTMAALYSRALAEAKGWDKELPQDLANKLGREALSPAEVQLLGKALSHYKEATSLFREAAQYDGIVNLPEVSVTPGQQQLDVLGSLREGARLLSAHACYSASQGQGDEATDYCIVLLRYACAFPGYNLLSELVDLAITGIACRTIEHTQATAPCSAEKLEPLRSALGQSVEDTPLVRAFCGERVCGIYLFQSGWVGGPRFFRWPNQAAYLAVLRDFVQVSRLPFPASLQKMTAADWPYRRRPTGPLAGFSALAYHLTPALQSAVEKGAATQAQVRVTLVSLAIRRARLDGAPLPASLQELVPKYLSVVPTDPFTGEPLRYRIAEIGCSIYSVGYDGVDDGGNPDTSPKGDIVVHLPR